MRLIFKTKMLINHPKDNLDVKIFIVKIIHLVDPEIRKMLVRGLYGNKSPTFPHSGPLFYFIN